MQPQGLIMWAHVIRKALLNFLGACGLALVILMGPLMDFYNW